MTISTESKQFAAYLLQNLIPQTVDNQQSFVNRVAAIVPGLDVKRAGMDAVQWETIAPKIVDHFAEQYEPGKLRQTA